MALLSPHTTQGPAGFQRLDLVSRARYSLRRVQPTAHMRAVGIIDAPARWIRLYERLPREQRRAGRRSRLYRRGTHQAITFRPILLFVKPPSYGACYLGIRPAPRGRVSIFGTSLLWSRSRVFFLSKKRIHEATDILSFALSSLSKMRQTSQYTFRIVLFPPKRLASASTSSSSVLRVRHTGAGRPGLSH